jgi:hypothetical protein
LSDIESFLAPPFYFTSKTSYPKVERTTPKTFRNVGQPLAFSTISEILKQLHFANSNTGT